MNWEPRYNCGDGEQTGGAGLAVRATQHIRRMRGGAQGHLMLGEDSHAYVVKFANNPQHVRVLANELMASRMAAAAGLTAPHGEIVEVSQWLVENTPEMTMDLGRRKEPCRAGRAFGSRFVGGLMPGQVVDYLPAEPLLEVRNLREFAGVLALDKWTGNANGRQAVFQRKQRERMYRAWFIDWGYCFHAGEWRFEDAPLRGVYHRNEVYREVRGWEDFEPWLSRMEAMDGEVLWGAANETPAEWYGGDVGEMEALVEKLVGRRGRIRELIEGFRRTEREPFPNWGKGRAESVKEVWLMGGMGTTMVQ
ncbi:MAG TPA: HipA family kinase [Terracidiphilus sp.]|nr:HipA family kinase [Terracidiphilus sp.]